MFDAIFPQLTPGVVAHFNRSATALPRGTPLPQEMVEESGLQRAMLFELAVAVAEQLMDGHSSVDWEACLSVAVARQRRHFDAELPLVLSEEAQAAAFWTANNLVMGLHDLAPSTNMGTFARAPFIPGFQRISSSVGDFSSGTVLIEVKCTNKRFSASDYRQVVMYWLLSYAAALESSSLSWDEVVLINPRTCLMVRMLFADVVAVIGAGRSKVEIVELFSALMEHADEAGMEARPEGY